jgi:cell division protein FtsZ
LVFLCAGIGGGTGTGATPVIAQLIKNSGATVVSIVTAPFKLERQRYNKAEAGIKAIMDASNSIIVVDNEALLHISSQDMSMAEFFKMISEGINGIIENFIRMFMSKDFSNVEPSKLKDMMTKGGLGIILKETGKDIDEIVDLLTNDANSRLSAYLQNTQQLILNISSGGDIKMGDINKIFESIANLIPENVQVVFSVNTSQDNEAPVEVTVILISSKTSKNLENARILQTNKVR